MGEVIGSGWRGPDPWPRIEHAGGHLSAGPGSPRASHSVAWIPVQICIFEVVHVPSDTPLTCRFGERVTGIVEGCTDSETIPKPPWENRKRVYIKRLSEASASVRLVCAADKLHNARSILSDYRNLGEEIWQRVESRKEGTLWYYQSVVDTLI